MLKNKKILVVGTTSDYIDLLRSSFKDRVVFLTDFQEKLNIQKNSLDVTTEIFCDSEDYASSMKALSEFLRVYDISLSGIVCFDCESLGLASMIAAKYLLPFPGLESISHCRSKYQSKYLWKKNGVPCPEVRIVKLDTENKTSTVDLDFPVVLKPLSGSGSELVFCAQDNTEYENALQIIKQRLSVSTNRRMYSSIPVSKEYHPRKVVVVEEFIPGDEYSCDFILEENKVKLLRFSKKIIGDEASFGTVSAYMMPAQFPAGWTSKRLEKRLLEASNALGLNRMIAMADLKFTNHEFYLLELTPRLGGDCLPMLIKACIQLDVFQLALDFSEGKETILPLFESGKSVIGMPIISSKQGILKDLNLSLIKQDSRVFEIQIKRQSGDHIKLPPLDYDSRLLAYVLFYPDSKISIDEQCRDLLQKSCIVVEEEYAVR